MKNQTGPFTDLPDLRQLAIYAGWTPDQRWERAVSLRDQAWRLKLSFVRVSGYFAPRTGQ
jgi:hypothetical protein